MHKLACRSSFLLSLLALGLVAQPAMAQNRFMDEAREKAARRAENAAIREAEHPETVRPATTKEADARTPAKSQPSAPPAETQAAEAAPTPPPAPAQ